MIRVIQQQIRCNVCESDQKQDGFKIEFDDLPNHTNTVRLCKHHANILTDMLMMQFDEGMSWNVSIS